MTDNLTQEEIVTKILSSNEIIRKQKDNFYISNTENNLGNLGLFLSKIPKDENLENYSKYSFIKSSWNI